MLDDGVPFEQVIEQLRRGEEEGANHVFHLFATRLHALAQARLAAAVRDKVGPEDVMQSAFRSFFSLAQKADEARRFDVRNWDGLWAVLVVIAVRKCRRLWRRYQAAGRDVRREQGALSSEGRWEAVDREPSPEDAAALAEVVERLLGRLTVRDRAVVEGRLRGGSVEEIVAQTGRSERAVYRVLAEARGHLKGLLEAGGEE